MGPRAMAAPKAQKTSLFPGERIAQMEGRPTGLKYDTRLKGWEGSDDGTAQAMAVMAPLSNSQSMSLRDYFGDDGRSHAVHRGGSLLNRVHDIERRYKAMMGAKDKFGLSKASSGAPTASPKTHAPTKLPTKKPLPWPHDDKNPAHQLQNVRALDKRFQTVFNAEKTKGTKKAIVAHAKPAQLKAKITTEKAVRQWLHAREEHAKAQRQRRPRSRRHRTAHAPKRSRHATHTSVLSSADEQLFPSLDGGRHQANEVENAEKRHSPKRKRHRQHKRNPHRRHKSKPRRTHKLRPGDIPQSDDKLFSSLASA